MDPTEGGMGGEHSREFLIGAVSAAEYLRAMAHFPTTPQSRLHQCRNFLDFLQPYHPQWSCNGVEIPRGFSHRRNKTLTLFVNQSLAHKKFELYPTALARKPATVPGWRVASTVAFSWLIAPAVDMRAYTFAVDFRFHSFEVPHGRL